MPFVVFNKHCHPDMEWCDEVVFVMRPSVLGNPFPMTRIQSREVAIAKYELWLRQQLMDPASLQSIEIRRLAELHKQGNHIALLCCCAPLRCHAEIIASITEKVALTKHAASP